MTGPTAQPGSNISIDLARETHFQLGRLRVSPSTREVLSGSEREVLEPRVMQVLVALYRADGAVVSRDDLITRCWEGRIVGEDAISKAIWRLRKLSEDDQGASFTIETIPRVGYRLRILSSAPASAPPPSETSGPVAPPAAKPARRAAIAALGAGLIATGTGYWYFTRRAPVAAPPPAEPPELATMVTRGIELLGDPSPAAMTRSVALFQQVIEKAPRNADAWGGLALAFVLLSHKSPQSDNAMRLRALAAIAQAQSIDPKNRFLWSAKGRLPDMRDWLERERANRQGLVFHPNDSVLLYGLATVLANTGRNAEAADKMSRAVAAAQPRSSNIGWFHIYVLWAANRLVEADAAAAEEIGLFPRDYSVWINRLTLLISTGRSVEALATLSDLDTRPPGFSDIDFDDLIAVATAFKTGNKADISRAGASLMASARRGSAYAERAILFLSGLGLIDEAFAAAEATFFNRGFEVSPYRYTKALARYARLGDRRTMNLFVPPTQTMRSDARFLGLVEELGLARYWKDTGSRPDYQLSKPI